MSSKIIWKPIKGWERKYAVSNTGRVRNIRTGNLLAGFYTPGGHYVIRFYLSSSMRDGKRVQRNEIKTVASLVAEAFIGDRPYGHILRYKNGDRNNCHVSNLAYLPLATVRKTQPQFSKYRPKEGWPSGLRRRS